MYVPSRSGRESAWYSGYYDGNFVLAFGKRADRLGDKPRRPCHRPLRDQILGRPFLITKKYRQELDNKINSFRDSLKLRRTIHLVFITTYGLKPNEYSGVVQNEVTLKDLFE